MAKILVLGAGGFIGGHLVKRLKRDGHWVRGVDLKLPQYGETPADDFIVGDLRDPDLCRTAVDTRFDEVYQLAADMGGAGYIFTGANDAEIMHNSATINLNVLDACRRRMVSRVFYASSACIYPQENQTSVEAPVCREDTAYPANPDSDYGWEKLFSERLYLAYGRNHGMAVRIARYHNVFGPEGAWDNGREKAPAAVCRKVARAEDGGEVEVWGDGRQSRSFLYIDECLEGTLRLMRSDFGQPVNIGSEEMVSIDQLVAEVAAVAGKRVRIRHVPGPQGVRGRRSDNGLIRSVLDWAPQQPLRTGLEHTYRWIAGLVDQNARDR
ncbi:NAD-dependent epimerase/dehydratase family protein [Azospirillum sp. CT11-132]|uniref:NAD-dependent epimerase/dehydratase family protein n=1 Tax=Azospirillum sp. CT11-132 TaxID=3396317 RepID=UPI0039A7419C